MAGLVCWSCGGSLAGVPRPIRRLTKCPTCKCDLHVCRMCRHWAPGTLGECDHERAERVADKASANFCTHYRPRRGAHAPSDAGGASDARHALNALFGVQETAATDATAAPADPGAAAREASDRARRALAELFDLPEEGAPDERREGKAPE